MLELILIWVYFGLVLLVETYGLVWLLWFRDYKTTEHIIQSVFLISGLVISVIGTAVIAWQKINEITSTLSTCS